MADEYFFGVTLSATNKEYKWEPDSLKENGGDVSLSPQGEHCLVLKRALLVKGKTGEVNIVQAATTGYKQEVEIPILTLEAGKKEQIYLDLSFPDTPVTFKLIEGSGPVHITGIHAVQIEEYMQDAEEDFSGEEDLDDDEEEEEEAAEPEKPKGKGKKRTNSNSGPAPSKKKKNGKESA